MPPAHPKLGKVAGTVTDPVTHDPIVGVPVTLAFQGGGRTNPTDVTDGSGHYAIGGVPVGHYGKIAVLGGGYDPSAKPVKVTASGATVDLQTRRDWAASSGGASIPSHTGPNYGGCGPAEVIDLSQATAWSTTSFNSGNGYVSRNMVIKLGGQVDVSDVRDGPVGRVRRWRECVHRRLQDRDLDHDRGRSLDPCGPRAPSTPTTTAR